MDGASRAARGWLLALSSAGLAIAAHAAAAGGVPETSVAVVVTAVFGWASTALADKIRGFGGTVAVLAVGQLLMHVVLTVLATHPGADPHFTTEAMILAHLAATVVTAALLSHADHGLRAVANSLHRLLPPLFSPPRTTARPAPAVVSVAPGGMPEVLLYRVRTRRGPPLRS